MVIKMKAIETALSLTQAYRLELNLMLFLLLSYKSPFNMIMF